MSIEFVDLDKAGPDREEEKISDLGFLLMTETGPWFAYHGAAKLQLASEGSLKPLAGHFWISDIPFERIKPVSDEVRSANFRSDGWLRLTAAQMRASWGVVEAPPARAARILAGSASRIWRLTQETLCRDMAERSGSIPPDMFRKIQRSASLATGVALAHGARLEAPTPEDERAREHLRRAYQSGMYIPGRKGVDIGEVRLTFQFPRLSYALSLTEKPVPGLAVWQAATRRDKLSSEDFVRNLSETGRPAIYKAVSDLSRGGIPEAIEAFANRPGSGETHRTRWIEEEIHILARYGAISVEGAIAGSGWVESSTGRLLRTLRDVAGGEGPAAGSWSVGVAAENILTSAFRKAGKDSKDREVGSPEAVWLAARDRVAMLPAVMRLCEVGGSLVSAQGGTIVVKAPADPELLMVLAATAWEAGLHLPLGEAEALNAMGVSIPMESSLFGGKDVDYPLSLVVHRGQRVALWRLDEVMDFPIAEREKAYRVLMP